MSLPEIVRDNAPEPKRRRAKVMRHGDGTVEIVLRVHPKVRAAIEVLVRTGYFGVTVEGCADEMLRYRLRELAREAAWPKWAKL